MVKLGRLLEHDVDDSFALMRDANVQVEGAPNAAIQMQTLRLAAAHDLTYSDPAYLELALRKISFLAALDQDLKCAAARVGIQCLAL